MATWRYDKTRRKGKRGSMKSRSKRVVRKAGAFGLYRGTRGMGMLRSVARRYARGTIPRSLNPFPNTKLVRHKYVETITHPAGAAAGSRSYYQFSCNDMYDPNVTSTGHQPLFRDEMAAQYNFYTVLSSRIKVTIPCESDIITDWALWADDDTSLPTNYDAAREQHRFVIGVKQTRRNMPLVLTGWYNAAKWHKTTRAGILSDDVQKVGKGESPGNKAMKYWTIWRHPTDPLDQTEALPIVVEIVHYTLWREPVDHAGS